jgi:hypothetical protein
MSGARARALGAVVVAAIEQLDADNEGDLP